MNIILKTIEVVLYCWPLSVIYMVGKRLPEINKFLNQKEDIK